LAIADRLSEDRNIKVAVIEPGISHQLTSPVLSTTPAGDVVFVGAAPTDQNILIDWHFVTTPQPGANGRSLSYTRGKCLGGT
jgi:choline dehydrogenase